MRNNQVSITICRYNEQVPNEYPESRQILQVNSDSNNLFEALAKAYTKCIEAIEEWQPVAARTSVMTNADNANSARILTRHSDNYRLKYLKEKLNINKALVFYFEHSEEIMEVIKNSANKETAREILHLRYGFENIEITAILRLRLVMINQSELTEIKREIEEMEQVIKEKEKGKDV